MKILVLLANLVALGIGGVVVVLASRLDREHRHPPVRAYLVFVVLAVVSGFFDWIVFSLVVVFVPGVAAGELDAIFHLFWNVIGFPSAAAAAAWLLFALLGFTNVPLSRRWKAVLATPFAVVGALSVIRPISRAARIDMPPGSVLWQISSVGLPLVHVVTLATAYGLSYRLAEPSRTRIRQFIVLLFVGLVGWHVLGFVPSPLHPSNHVSIVWFYAALLPPTLFLRWYLRSLQRQEVLEANSRESLALVFESVAFTEREKDVLVLLLKGKSYKVMQDDLCVSLQTVKNYVSRIYAKLEVGNRVELVNLVRNMTERRR